MADLVFLADDFDTRVRHDAASIDLNQNRSQCLCCRGVRDGPGMPSIHTGLADHLNDPSAGVLAIACHQHVAFDLHILLE